MKKNRKENYLTRRPKRKAEFVWEREESGLVTLQIPNKGVFNRMFQWLFKKPKITYVHLDEMGSFLWPKLCGEKDLIQLGEEVREAFGEKAEPLYPRLAKYIQTLHSYGWVEFSE